MRKAKPNKKPSRTIFGAILSECEFRFKKNRGIIDIGWLDPACREVVIHSLTVKEFCSRDSYKKLLPRPKISRLGFPDLIGARADVEFYKSRAWWRGYCGRMRIVRYLGHEGEK